MSDEVDLAHQVKRLKGLGIEVELDRHQPGGMARVWAVLGDRGSRVGYSGRMSTAECMLFLCGMVTGAEMYQEVIAKATRDNPLTIAEVMAAYRAREGK